MEWIFLTVLFICAFIYEIIDRICECKEKCNNKRSKDDKYKDILL